MNAWTTQADGSVLGVATPKAIEWADTQPQRQTAHAQVGFVAWCRDMQLDPFWTTDNAPFVATSFGVIEVLLDNTFPFNNPDTFKVGAVEGGKWYAVVRILPTGSGVVIHILGLSGTLAQKQPAEDGSIPRNQLLSCREWLRAFPIHHVTYTEATA